MSHLITSKEQLCRLPENVICTLNDTVAFTCCFDCYFFYVLKMLVGCVVSFIQLYSFHVNPRVYRYSATRVDSITVQFIERKKRCPISFWKKLFAHKPRYSDFMHCYNNACFTIKISFKKYDAIKHMYVMNQKQS